MLEYLEDTRMGSRVSSERVRVDEGRDEEVPGSEGEEGEEDEEGGRAHHRLYFPFFLSFASFL